MGFHLDWVSIAGLTKDEALARLGLVDTGQETDWFLDAFTWAATPDGRIVIATDNHGSFQQEDLAAWSQGISLVAGRAESNYVTAIARGFEDGREIWSLSNEAKSDLEAEKREVLAIEGSPPAELSKVRLRVKADREEHEREHGSDGDGMWVFETILEMTAELGGFAPENSVGADLQFFKAARAPRPKTQRTDEPGLFSRISRLFRASK